MPPQSASLFVSEPSICRKLLRHAPVLASQPFAGFSQVIGLASLGTSGEGADKLARRCLRSAQLGLCMEGGKHKVCGARPLSPFGELKHACSDKHPGAESPPELKPWGPEVSARQELPITTCQPACFVAENAQGAKARMRKCCKDLQRLLFALHNPQTDAVHADHLAR